ncbi:hypothetical protein O3P69_001489 [Scylla paramamosain]|uniref:Uncharacterized protein n=1 Tax=Scylla paramamosain TaxID=85552 RepID=A0AAW0UZA5_SCYPA
MRERNAGWREESEASQARAGVRGRATELGGVAGLTKGLKYPHVRGGEARGTSVYPATSQDTPAYSRRPPPPLPHAATPASPHASHELTTTPPHCYILPTPPPPRTVPLEAVGVDRKA